MASPEDRQKHRRRLQNKKKRQGAKHEKVRSPIAKALEEPQNHPRVIQDKRGKKHNLDDMTFRDLVEEIQEDN